MNKTATEVPGHSRCCTIKISLCSKVINDQGFDLAFYLIKKYNSVPSRSAAMSDPRVMAATEPVSRAGVVVTVVVVVVVGVVVVVSM